MNRLLYLLCFLPILAWAQPQQANLLYNWNDPSIVGSAAFDNAYNEIWGLVSNDREFAVIGSTEGTHFVDVTEPGSMIELRSAFVEGAVTGPSIIHRDYHDYECYLYAVADEGFFSSLQIIDVSQLPDTTVVLYDSQDLIRRAHNIFIDTSTAKLYACAVNSSVGYYPLQVYSLADPLNPVLLSSHWSIGGVSIPIIHDIYVKDDIAYLNGSNDGLLVADFSDQSNPQIIGTLDSYPDQGYNHSGWLSDDGQTYFLADETHGTGIKSLDVSDPTDITVLDVFDAESTSNSIPHNLIVRGNYLYVSYYYDGLQVFDISDPSDVQRVAFYDTYPQSNINSYEGAWGVFPYLPSGRILISDMQTGLYVFDQIDQGITGELPPLGSSANCENLVSTNIEKPIEQSDIRLVPNPVFRQFQLQIDMTESQETNIQLFDLTGRLVKNFGQYELIQGPQTLSFQLDNHLPKGMYILQIQSADGQQSIKLVKE
ncbi:MAG: choice-of-anchor B family protein [Bacteroidota bacterium]